MRIHLGILKVKGHVGWDTAADSGINVWFDRPDRQQHTSFIESIKAVEFTGVDVYKAPSQRGSRCRRQRRLSDAGSDGSFSCD